MWVLTGSNSRHNRVAYFGRSNTPSLRMCFFWGQGCVWPSKRSFVLAMMYCHNIVVFWGPYTPSTAPKIIFAYLGACRPFIQIVGVERKASCGALGGHICQWRPWSAMVVWVNFGHWRLPSDQPTVGIVKIVYRSIFSFHCRSHTFLTSDPKAKTLAAHGLEEPFFQLCCCVSFLVLVGNRLLTYLEYNRLWHCVSFLVEMGNSFWCYTCT
jgi:hypothetical protein